MSMALAALLVYTVGVKCRGINKKVQYAPEQMFSLSENAVNKMIRGNASSSGGNGSRSSNVGSATVGVGGGGGTGMMDLIKHTRGHLVRTYPKGMRVASSNYEPHRFWATGCQLVALNWQTFGAFTFLCFVIIGGRASWES